MAEPGYWQNLQNFTGEPIDYVNSPRRPPLGGMPGQFAGPAFNPAANWLATAGVQQPPGFWQELSRWAAPAVDRTERISRGVVQGAGEMTGLPSAARAGTAAAEGNLPQAAGNALMALPSRMGSILGAPLASAEAQTPDPRQKRLDKLDSDIAKAQAEIKRLGERTMKRDPKSGRWVPDTDRLNVLARPQQQVLDSAVPEATSLRNSLNAEFQAARDAELAASRGAQWANTPFAKKYPGAPAGLAGVAAVGSLALPAIRGRRGVTAFERDAQSLSTRVKDAVDRANNTSLDPRLRTQAANEARQLQAQYETTRGAGPQTGGHGRAFLEGAVPMEAALVAPAFADYVSSEPGSELRNYTLDANNPIAHPGEVLARYGLGFGAGGVLGELGHILSDRLANPGTDHGGEVNALNKRYASPRKAPPKRKR